MKKLFELIKLYWGYIATVAAIAGSAWGLKSDIEKKAIKEYSDVMLKHYCQVNKKLILN